MKRTRSLTKPARAGSRVAAIDMGSNAVRMIVMERTARGALRVLDEERRPTQLALGLAHTGRLSARAIRATRRALEDFLLVARAYKVDRVQAVATEAVRRAANGARFLRMIRKDLGLEVRLIDPREEGTLVYRAMSDRPELRRGPAMIVDIGGGSVQLIFGVRGVVTRVVSMPIGAVRMTDAFDGPAAIALDKARRLQAHIEHELARGAGRIAPKPRVLFGTGGTFTAVGQVVGKKNGGRERVDHRTLRRLIAAFVRSAPKPPLFLAKLSADRAGIFLTGLVIADRVLTLSGLSEVRPHNGGVRHGLARGMFDELRPAPAGPVDEARRVVRACGVDAKHAQRVAQNAAWLYERLCKIKGAWRTLAGDPRRSAVLLQAAALLHDVGYLVDEQGHHKHSAEIILSWPWRTLGRDEVSLVAQIARYHRRSEPSPEHPLFAALNHKDQHRVEFLSGILRVADALDRSHTQRVKPALLSLKNHALELGVRSSSRPLSELRACHDKSMLLQRVLGLPMHAKHLKG